MLRRDLAFHMIQTYIPSVLIVVLSWVSFWLSYDAVPARISLGVLTVLTMTTMASGMAPHLPRVSYVKAMDVWLSTCQFFVFAALIEFALVNVLARSQRQNEDAARRKKEEVDDYREKQLEERGFGKIGEALLVTS